MLAITSVVLKVVNGPNHRRPVPCFPSPLLCFPNKVVKNTFLAKQLFFLVTERIKVDIKDVFLTRQRLFVTRTGN